jgi:integrase
MNQMTFDFTPSSREVFAAHPVPTLADVKIRVAANETNPVARRDMIWGFNQIEETFEKSLSAIPAAPKAVRNLFSEMELKLPSAKTKPKTFKNIRSYVTRALRDHGEPIQCLTRRIPPAQVWQRLLDRIDKGYWRRGLTRLACYCTVMGIPPEDVTVETLFGLYAALDAEETVKDPRNLLKQNISSWNRCVKDIDDWPQTRLSSPFTKTPWTMPLDAFPASFRADVDAWVWRMTNIRPLDPDSPPRALKPETIDQRVEQFRMMGSALVHSNTLTVDDVTAIAVFFEGDNFKAAFQWFLDLQDEQRSTHLYLRARNMRSVAKHFVKVAGAELEDMADICGRLKPKGSGCIPEKYRERVRPFENRDVLKAHFTLPERLAEEARACLIKSPVKAARLMERAVVWALQSRFAMRAKTLRMLDMEKNFKWQQSGNHLLCTLSIPEDIVKNRQHLEFEVPEDVALLIDEFRRVFRPRLPWSGSNWLLAGKDGAARSKSAMDETVRTTARKYLGLTFNQHLFRYVLAKFIVETNPGSETVVQRVLGHTSLNTTYAHYLGTETKAAGQHIDSIIERMLKNEDDCDDR